MNKFAPLLAVMAVLSLTACERADPASDPQFGAKVRAYLLEHPEVLIEAQERLQAKRIAEAIHAARDSIERDPRDFVANPNGKITVTEFYDYRCGHCVNIAPEILKLIRENPDVRFVFKEMPIFGETSEAAARAALAVKQSGGNYLGLYEAYMGNRSLDGAAIERLALANGAAAAKLNNPEFVAAANAQLLEVHALAGALGIDGTPSFVVGDQMIPGENLPALKAAIAAARAKA